MTHLLKSLNKPCNDKASQIDIFTNRLDNSGQHNHAMSAFIFILILNQSYHQPHIADEPTYIIAKV